MAIELHNLNTHGMMEKAGKVLDGVARLKARIAELEEELRWRKCSDELPKDGETVLVLLGRTPKTRGFFLTSRYVAGGWTYGEDPQGCKPTHWFRIPKAPEVDKIEKEKDPVLNIVQEWMDISGFPKEPEAK